MMNTRLSASAGVAVARSREVPRAKVERMSHRRNHECRQCNRPKRLIMINHDRPGAAAPARHSGARAARTRNPEVRTPLHIEIPGWHAQGRVRPGMTEDGISGLDAAPRP